MGAPAVVQPASRSAAEQHPAVEPRAPGVSRGLFLFRARAIALCSAAGFGHRGREHPRRSRGVNADDGSFEFTPVAPGIYTLHLVTGISDTGVIGPAIRTIVVESGDVTGLEIDLARTRPPAR
jgi:hypothetical protein